MTRSGMLAHTLPWPELVPVKVNQDFVVLRPIASAGFRLRRLGSHVRSDRGSLISASKDGTTVSERRHGARCRLSRFRFAPSTSSPHRRSHRVLLHPPRRRRGGAGAGTAQPEALSCLGAQGRRRRPAGADRGRAGPRRGPELRARVGPPGAHPRRTPPPLGGGRAGEDEGQGEGAERRQVEGEVHGARRAEYDRNARVAGGVVLDDVGRATARAAS